MIKSAFVAVNMRLSYLFGSLLIMGSVGTAGPVHAAIRQKRLKAKQGTFEVQSRRLVPAPKGAGESMLPLTC